MTTTQYLRAYARFWWVILLCTAIGVGVSAAASTTHTPTYKASVDLVLALTKSVPQAAPDYVNANVLAQQRAVTYAAAADGTVLAKKTAEADGVTASARQLRTRLSVGVPSGSTVLGVTAESDTPTGARALAVDAGQAMQQVVTALEARTTFNRPLLRARLITTSLTDATKEDDSSAWRDPLLCGVAGLLVGLAIAVALARLLPRLRDPKVVSSVVGAPVLGVLPRRRRNQEKYDAALEGVRTGVFFLRDDADGCLVVALASPGPVDDWTEDAADLAAAMSATGARVLLVHADLRPATDAGASDDLETRTGLADYLSGGVTLKGLITRDPAGHHVMRAGRPVEGSDDLLHGTTYADLLREASSRYDYVLVVAPPTSRGTGALAVSARAGATVLIVGERLRAKQVRESLEMLETVSVRPSGAVLVR